MGKVWIKYGGSMEELKELKEYIEEELNEEIKLTEDNKDRHNNRQKTFHQGMVNAYEIILEEIEVLEG